MKKIVFSLLFFFALTVSIFLLRPLGETNWIVEQGIYILSVLFVATSTFLALRKYGRGPRFRSLLCFTLGYCGFIIAELSYMYFDFIVHDLPYPSIGDYFFLVGYVLVFLGIVFELLSTSISWRKIHALVYVVSGIFTISILGAFAYFTAFLSYDSQVSLGENIVTIGYTVGDIILIIGLFFLSIMAWEYRKGKVAKVWIIFFIGILLGTVGDLVYALYTEQVESHSGFIYLLSQCLYIIGYLLAGYAFLYFRAILHSFQVRALGKTAS